MLRIEKLPQADAASTADFILIARPDAAAGGADGLSRSLLAEAFFLQMIREDHVRVIAENQVIAHGNSGRAEIVHFFQKPRGKDDDSVGNHGAEMRFENPSRKQGELESFPPIDDSMSGVSASVEANDKIVLIGEEIDDLAFGLVAPLQADDTGAGHCLTYSGRSPGRDIRAFVPVWDGPQKTPATPKVSGYQSGAW
jgi:hypothetical protein